MKHFTYEGTIINYYLFIQRKLTCLYLRQNYFRIQTSPSITFQYIELNKNWIPYNLPPMSYSSRCPYHGRISSKKSFKHMLGSKRVPSTRGMCEFQMNIRLFITHYSFSSLNFCVSDLAWGFFPCSLTEWLYLIWFRILQLRDTSTLTPN